MNRLHRRKMLAPILIAVVLLLYYTVYFVFFLSVLRGYVLFLLGILPLAAGGLTVYVLIQRIAEIQGGEEDDLGKY